MGRIRATLHGSQLRNAKLNLEEKAALAARFGYQGVDFSLAEAEGAGDDPGPAQGGAVDRGGRLRQQPAGP